ncbi:AraC family transcriptional regulator [Trinickia dabaoshanensis]|uniref:AraC family transcriptional regulator n=1 Tax=Trinickia dabaoshanensis TaxID=564714 RepID=A0A2N7VX75_9BURK|nr:AraC family transcriptional regulator [Trinickia dabaoshanensis]PMS21751.1 AraC family transcriptional regulator [Trinickia dabaoshanensis]
MQSADTANRLPACRDDLGCAFSKLRKNVEIAHTEFTFYRKCMDEEQLDRVEMPGCERGFLIGVSLNGGHRRRIFRGPHVEDRYFETHSIYVRDFSESYRADLYGRFDFILAEMPRAFLDRLADEHDLPRIAGLTGESNRRDPVLGHLAAALAANAEGPGKLDALFVEQMGLTIGIHLARQYGNAPHREAGIKGALTAAQEARAKEMLLSRPREGLTLADVARECNVSRAHFIRAFARTTGRTPHQWLLEQRVHRARELIERSALALSNIAVMCGFADQSHMNRVFQKTLGTTPGAWRRPARR